MILKFTIKPGIFVKHVEHMEDFEENEMFLVLNHTPFNYQNHTTKLISMSTGKIVELLSLDFLIHRGEWGVVNV